MRELSVGSLLGRSIRGQDGFWVNRLGRRLAVEFSLRIGASPRDAPMPGYKRFGLSSMSKALPNTNDFIVATSTKANADTSVAATEVVVALTTDSLWARLSKRISRRVAVSAVVVGTFAIIVLGYVLIGNDTTPMAPPELTVAERFDEQFTELQKSGETVARLDAFTIDDSMLRQLASLDRLMTIQVKASDVSLETIAAIAKMPKLEQLHVRGAAINDDMLAALTSSPSIWLLNFPNAEVSPAGIESLAKMPALRNLRLGIKDGNNRHGRAVATLSRLRTVHLIRVAITDEGLQALAKMPQLESLYLDDSSITDAGWTWLFEENPQLHVHINQKHHDRDPQKH